MLQRRLLPTLLAALLIPAASAAAAPYNDDFADAGNLGSSSSASLPFSLSGATTEPGGEPNHFNGGAQGHTVWFRWTPAKSGGTHIKVCDNDSGRIKVYTGASVGGLVAAEFAPGGALDCDSQYRIMATAGTTYRIVLDHTDGGVDYDGTIKVDQRTQKPIATFPGWPATTGTTLKGHVLRSSTYVDGWDNLYGAFTCEIDDKPVYCDEFGPYLKDLTDGEHKFEAQARDPYGNVQANFSTLYWDVDAVGPTTTVTSWQGMKFTTAAPLIEWTADEPGVTFQCRIHAIEAEAKPCTSPVQAPDLPAGHAYGLTIYATDAYGNHGKPVSAQWTVPEPAPVSPATGTTTTTTTTARTAPGTTTTRTGTTSSPAGPCAPTVKVLTRSQRTIRRRGMKVAVAGDGRNICVLRLSLRAGRRTVAHLIKTIGPSSRLTLTLKPHRRVRAGLRIRLVKGA